jgi:RNase P subunit RPR2
MIEVCKKCGTVIESWKEIPKVFSNGTNHIELRCPDCQWFYKYKPQNNDFELWFGKYKGKKVSEVLIEDYDYLWWLLENSDEKFSNKLQATMDKLNKK